MAMEKNEGHSVEKRIAGKVHRGVLAMINAKCQILVRSSEGEQEACRNIPLLILIQRNTHANCKERDINNYV